MRKKQRQALMANEERRNKYKAAAVSAIILSIISIFFTVYLFDFRFSFIGFALPLLRAIIVFVWIAAFFIVAFSVFVWAITIGSTPILGLSLFQLNVENLNDETRFNIFIALSVLAALFALFALGKSISQFRINRRAVGFVGLTFSLTALIVAAAIIAVTFISIYGVATIK